MNIATETSAAPSLCWVDKSDDDVIEYILSISEELQRGGIRKTNTTTCVHRANAINKYLQMSRENERQQEMLRLGVMLFGAIHQLNVNTLRANYKKLIIRIHPDKNHHEHAHDVFQLVHTCFEYMQERIKLEHEHLKQQEWYSANKQSQECKVPQFTRSNYMNRTKCSKWTSLPDNKPQRFHPLMQCQSYPCIANLNKTTTFTKATRATNYVPSLFSQTHVPASSWHKPFPWKMTDRMEHKECDNNGVSQTHSNHTTSLSFTHAALPSRLFTRKHIGNAKNYRWEVPHNSRTRDMHVNKKELHNAFQVNHVKSLDSRAKQKEQSTIANKEDVLPSHEHCSHPVRTKYNYNISKHHHDVFVHANASRDITNNNNNIISSNSNSISNNSHEEQMQNSMSELNDNYSRRNWEEVEQWARHILDSESDNDNIDSSYDNKDVKNINIMHEYKKYHNSFMCDDDDNSTDNYIRYEGNKYYNDNNFSSTTSSSDDDMWGEMEKTNNDVLNTQCQQIRHKTRAVANRYNTHKYEKSLSSNMYSERFNRMPCYNDYCNYNEHHSVDESYLSSSFDDKLNKEEYSEVRTNDSKSYNKAKHSFHSNLSFCSSLSFSSELSSASHYSSHTFSSTSSSSASSSPFS